MSVYIVTTTNESEVTHCEAYAGASAALGRAFQLASDMAKNHSGLFDHSPNEEYLSDGSCRWMFMETNRHTVQVIFRKIETALPAQNTAQSVVVPAPMTIGDLIKSVLTRPTQPAPSAPVPPTSMTIVVGPLPPYDFRDRSLPVGWKLDGQPALMGDLLDDPLNVTDPNDLTDAQKWAVVVARVRKSPSWKGIPKGSPIAWFSRDALTQLNAKSAIGALLRDGEIDSLHHLRDDLAFGTISP